MQFDFGMKALLAAHHARHTCKAYDETRKVPDEVMRFIVEVGRLSPSSFGFEPWQFLVIENQKLRHILHETAWGIREKIMDAAIVSSSWRGRWAMCKRTMPICSTC